MVRFGGKRWSTFHLFHFEEIVFLVDQYAPTFILLVSISLKEIKNF